MKKFLTVFVLSFLISPVAIAADPIPNAPTTVTSQPEFPKGPQYAAIAVSPKTLEYGTAQNKPSQAEAELAAKKQCTERSKALDCQTVVYFFDACGAIAIKRKGDVGLNLGGSNDHGGAYGADWGGSQSSAERKAKETCEDTAPSGCMVAKSFCSK